MENAQQNVQEIWNIGDLLDRYLPITLAAITWYKGYPFLQVSDVLLQLSIQHSNNFHNS